MYESKHTAKEGDDWVPCGGAGAVLDSSQHIQSESIGVYINPNNPKRYWVDTSFLPKQAA